MSKKRYEWEPGNSPPVIEAHSLAKHEVLDRYLREYIRVLAAAPGKERLPLNLIDGFAGGGVYTHHANGGLHLGSPFIFLNTLREAEAEMKGDGRRTQFVIDGEFFFIEQDRACFEYLSSTLKQHGYGAQFGRNIHLQCGAFVEVLPAIVEQIRSRKTTNQSWRCLFLLDQYGYIDVPFAALRRIFNSLPKAEVILTFATDWLLDYITDTASCRLALDKLGLDLDVGHVTWLKEHQPARWREFVQLALHDHLVSESGARFYTPFFIRSEKANRDYWLVHLSNHSRARDVMTTLHWSLSSRFRHYGKPGLDMLGYAASFDERQTGQPALPSEVFDFSTHARNLTLTSLRAELPDRIAAMEKHSVTLTFAHLNEQLCNLAPANTALMRQATTDLLRQGDIEVRSEDGSTRHRGQVKNTDRISLARQITIFHLRRPTLSDNPWTLPEKAEMPQMPAADKSSQPAESAQEVMNFSSDGEEE